NAIANELVIYQILLHQDAKNRGEAERISARTHRQMVVRHLGGLGASRIDYNERPFRIGRDIAQDRTRALEAMRLPRVLADKDRHLGLLVASRDPGAEQHMVDPELSCLFLGQRVGAEDVAKRAPSRRAIA